MSINIDIYWDDITKEKQEEILFAFGDNCDYDIFPITTIYEEDKERIEQAKKTLEAIKQRLLRGGDKH